MKHSIPGLQRCSLKQLLLLSVWSLLIVPIAAAQTERGRAPDDPGRKRAAETVFTYQGQLKEGVLSASGAYEFRFTLYSAQTEGEEIGSVTTEEVLVTDGLFTVRLNFVHSIPVSRESWLEVAVRRSHSPDPYTALTPRQRLTPTPYAILAKADPWSLIGVPVGFPDRRDSDRTVSSDPAAPDSREQIPAQAKTTTDDKVGGEKTTANAAAENSGWVAEKGIVRLSASADKVGIGTSTPQARLDVAGDLHVSGPVKSGNSITVDGSDHTITATTVTSQPYSKQIRIGYRDSASPGPFSDIRVGIGTLTPTATLHIFGTTFFSSGAATLENNNAVYLRAGASGGARILGVQGNTPARPAIGFFSTNGVDDGGGGNGIFRPLANTMAFATVSAERMRITSGGNVGIGTPLPGAMFTVGNNTFQVNNAGNLIRINNVPYSWPAAQGAPGTVLTNNAGTLSWAAPGGGVSGSCNTVGPNGSGTNFVTKWSSASAVTCSQIFDNGTNVGIGTTAPTARTEILHSNLSAGAFALRLTNQGTGGQFTESGLAFNVGLVGNPNYYAARIYAEYDGTGAADGRLTLQVRDGSTPPQFRDVLNVKDQRVGIMTTTPTNTLHVAGTVRVDTLAAAGGNPLCLNANVLSACPPSDGRLKTNVRQLTNVVSQLARVRGVSFNWNETSRPLVSSTGRREIGVIAQEVEAVFPEVVTSWGDNYKAVDYGKLSAVLIEAVKELKAENDALKQRIEALEKAAVKKQP